MNRGRRSNALRAVTASLLAFPVTVLGLVVTANSSGADGGGTPPPAAGASSVGAAGASRIGNVAASHAAAPVRLPLDFVENRGQWPTPVEFAARSGPVAASFTRGAIRLSLGKGDSAVPLVLRFEGASQGTRLVGAGRRSASYSFFVGDDPSRWRSNVRAYSGLLYRGLYDGIDVRVREGSYRLEYDVLVAPHADLDQLVIRTAGTSSLALGRDGALWLRTPSGSLRQAPPVAWQVRPDGSKQPVADGFRIIDAHRYSFAVPHRNPALALVIDPGLDWATFFGGNGDDSIDGLRIASDGTGDIIVAGQTRSPDFPHTGGNLVPVGGTPYVARLSSTGTTLKYATFFGGTFNHSVKDVALDATGDPIVVGDTNAIDFPTTPGAYDRTPPDGIHGDYDAYAIKFNATGNGLIFGTYLGGSPNSANLDQAWRVGVDPAGSVIVAGITTSPDFPTTVGAYNRTLHGRDIFVSRFNPTGTQLTYSTLFGGDTYDEVFAMAVDSQGFVDLTGKTSAGASTVTPFPTTPDAFDRIFDGTADAFVARFKLDGLGSADLKYSTLLGGAQWIEAGDGIAVDPTDPTVVTVSGFTRSGDFPTTVGALQRTHFAPIDTTMGFVTRFHLPAGAAGTLVWSTLYGAPGNQSADDVTVDGAGDAIIVGNTAANNPPTTERSYDRIPGNGFGDGFPSGKADAYVARISADGSRLLYSTLLGGSSADFATRVASAGGTSVVVTGMTNSLDFPVTTGAFDTLYAADGLPSGAASPGTDAYDGFIARLTLDAPLTGDTTPPAAPAPLGPADGATFTALARPVTFDWSDVTDPSGIAAYHLQVSPNSTFTNTFDAELAGWFEPWVPTSLAVKDFLSSTPGTWYWRVQALDGANNLGPWSAVRTINVVSPAPPPAPALTSPPNGGRFGPGSVVLAWNAAAGAVSYEVQVDTTSTFGNAGKTDVRGIPQTQYTVSLTREQTYFWRVRGTNANGVDGAWSTSGSFQIKNGSPPAPTPPPPPPPPAPPPLALAELTLGASPGTLTVFGASTVQGTVTLNAPAPAGGASVQLASTMPSRASVPPSVTVPAGSTTASFTVTTTSSSAKVFVSPVVSGAYGGSTQAALLFLYGEQPRQLDSFTVTTNTALGGSTVQATVALIPGWVAPPGGAIVTLGSTSPALASVPPSVTIPAGANSASFTITTLAVSTATDVTILAARSMTLRQTIQLLPPGALSSLSLAPSTVNGGDTSIGTVTLASPASAGGVLVALSSTNPTIAAVPASVTVPAGATSATFTVATSPVTGGGTFSEITAAAGGISRSAILNVNPAPTGPSLSSLTLSPPSVTGGGTSTGTVTLTAAAPAGGAAVSLSSSNAAAATAPASVTVAAGQTSATFTVTTSAVASSTAVTISATQGGVTKTATLTVTAPGVDTVAIQLAEYDVAKGVLSVEATSSNSTATLTAFVTSSGAQIGVLTNDGGGRYRGQLTWPVNPQNITVRSSLGGSASFAVTAK